MSLEARARVVPFSGVATQSREPEFLHTSRHASLVDALLIFFLSLVTGCAYEWLTFHQTKYFATYASTGVLIAVLFCSLFELLVGRHRARTFNAAARMRTAAIAWILTFLLLAFVAFTLKLQENFSRGAILSFFLAGLPLVVSVNSLAPAILKKAKESGGQRYREAVVIASRKDAAEKLMIALRAHGCTKVHNLHYDPVCSEVEWQRRRQEIFSQVVDISKSAGPGAIYVSSEGASLERVASILTAFRLLPRAVHLVPDAEMALFLGCEAKTIGRSVALEVQKEPLGPLSRGVKRAIDFCVALVALLFLAPLMVGIAMAIAVDSPGPVLFRQRRCGRGGQIFRIFKFRSMLVVEDGDQIRQAEKWDHRVTRVGHWLRKSSFDELPQLLNVISGEMSLVGPRPHAVSHDEYYSQLVENYELRQHVKPGMTGWAQIHGLRGETNDLRLMYRRIDMDLWYAVNCSISLDLLILLRTPLVLWAQTNAY